MDGEKSKTQDRFQFVEKIRMMLERHVHSDKPLALGNGLPGAIGNIPD